MKSIVSIVGRPNVGKSTLFNRLAGRRLAIVEEVAGVTRDRHYQTIRLGGKEVLLVDTGGIESCGESRGDGTDNMSGLIRGQAEMAIEESDIIIFLLDAATGLMPDDEEIADLLRRSSKPVLYVANKVDGSGDEPKSLALYQTGADVIHLISAKNNYKIREFKSLLADMVLGGVEPDNQPDIPQPDIPMISVIGRPNAGKSTLINQILGEKRLITSTVPGTTRDSIDISVEYDKKQYLFIDTAGMRRKGRVEWGVEAFSTIRTISSLVRSYLSILVIDGSVGITAQDTKIAGNILSNKKGILVAVNKADLLSVKQKEQVKKEVARMLAFATFAPIIFISAKEGTNIIELFREIDQIWASVNKRVTTGELNRTFSKILALKPPPMHKNRPVKIFYATQHSTRPPGFVIFTNRKDGVKGHYLRYIENSIREKFELYGTPVDIKIKEKRRNGPSASDLKEKQ